jgi:hypothetical protein
VSPLTHAGVVDSPSLVKGCPKTNYGYEKDAPRDLLVSFSDNNAATSFIRRFQIAYNVHRYPGIPDEVGIP